MNALNKKIKKNPNLFYHILIAAATCLMLVGIMEWDKNFFEAGLREGDIALRDIYAPYDFIVQGDVDVIATERAQKEASSKAYNVVTYDPKEGEFILKKITLIIDAISKMKESGLQDEAKLEEAKKIASSFNLQEALIGSILETKDLAKFSSQALSIASSIMSKYIISVSDHDIIKDSKLVIIKQRDNAVNEEVKKTAEFLTIDIAKEQLGELASSIKEKKERQDVKELLLALLSVNTSYNRDETDLEKRKAVSSIGPVYNIVEVKKNELIINKGQRVGKFEVSKLQGMEQKESEGARVGEIFAVGILMGLFIILLSMYISFYDQELIKGNKEMALLAIICVLAVLIAKIIVLSPWPSNLIPIAVSSMLIAVLINSRLALITTCFLSIIMGMISGNRLDITGMSLVGGIIGIFSMRGVRRRSQILRAGLAVGCANMSYFIAMGLIGTFNFNTYIVEASLGMANGIISAIIVAGILPVFENLFKISTDISLLELSDLNHPILKDMVIKAPGTYHHSLVVGNLAEAACEAIGANPLLARVGSYFHDIGKIEKAGYFSENQALGESVHDKLLPTMSSLIITNHVKNGCELAKQYKLNNKIIDIINQHHGTGLVFYFFKRALEKVKDEDDVGEESFRYPGPKPQTKEAACVLLADSVEAASRTLDEPTPSRIKGLVRKIINNKFIDGQLDECSLTLSDLEKIAEVFTHILTGIYHTRIEYPEEPDMNNRKR